MTRKILYDAKRVTSPDRRRITNALHLSGSPMDLELVTRLDAAELWLELDPDENGISDDPMRDERERRSFAAELDAEEDAADAEVTP